MCNLVYWLQPHHTKNLPRGACSRTWRERKMKTHLFRGIPDISLWAWCPILQICLLHSVIYTSECSSRFSNTFLLFLQVFPEKASFSLHWSSQLDTWIFLLHSFHYIIHLWRWVWHPVECISSIIHRSMETLSIFFPFQSSIYLIKCFVLRNF